MHLFAPLTCRPHSLVVMTFFFFALILLEFINFSAWDGVWRSLHTTTCTDNCNAGFMVLFGLIPIEFVGRCVDHAACLTVNQPPSQRARVVQGLLYVCICTSVYTCSADA